MAASLSRQWSIPTVLLLAACAHGPQALAQATQAPLRPSERPAERPGYLAPDAPPFELPAVPPRPAPDAASPASVVLRGVGFEGHTVVSDEDLQALARPFVGRPVTAADLEELRHLVTRLLVERGYVNSGALIPDDALQQGVLRVRIVEGRVGEVRVSGTLRLREGYVAERLVPSADEVLNVGTLQDRLQLLLADPLIAQMSGRLVPGAELGRSVLDVEVRRARPYRVALFADNHQPPSIGAQAAGVSATVWNLTGLGDALDAIVLKTEGARRYSTSWNVPVPVTRTLIGAAYGQGTASVVEEPIDRIDIVSRIRSAELSVTQPVVETPRDRFTLGLGWSRRQSSTTLLGEPFSFVLGEQDGVSRLQSWRFVQEYAHRWTDQVVALRSTFVRGRTNVPEGLGPAAAGRRYRLWLGQAQYAHRLGTGSSQVVLKATLQDASDRLLPLERIAVGGAATVRGYRENQLVRDSGGVASVELRFDVIGPPDSEQRLVLVPFIDAASARNQGETSERLLSAGLGFEWRWSGLSVSLHLARKLRTPQVQTSGNLQDRGVHFQLRWEPS